MTDKTNKQLLLDVLIGQGRTDEKIIAVDNKVTGIKEELEEHKRGIWTEVNALKGAQSKSEGKQEGIKETRISTRKMWMLVIAALGVGIAATTIIISAIN